MGYLPLGSSLRSAHRAVWLQANREPGLIAVGRTNSGSLHSSPGFCRLSEGRDLGCRFAQPQRPAAGERSRPTRRRATMKFPGIILALAAVAIAAPALSNAQASRPGPPTPIAQASSEKAVATTMCAACVNYAGRTSSLPQASTSSLGSRNRKRSLKLLSSTAISACCSRRDGQCEWGDRPPTALDWDLHRRKRLFSEPSSSTVQPSTSSFRWEPMRMPIIQTNPNSVFQGTATRKSRGR